MQDGGTIFTFRRRKRRQPRLGGYVQPVRSRPSRRTLRPDQGTLSVSLPGCGSVGSGRISLMRPPLRWKPWKRRKPYSSPSSAEPTTTDVSQERRAN
ncbi:hypothetical protein DPEC_G00185780 [Dallia pectoralis]|uniref:Uncharacterized protein n=1 Tax=Dallia pectoralis TaxID=75939 RepID=A0ACC2GB99_DALPE|nr:hypothetical protein DPEC_G00185780 [Dallia pectoralis]